MVTEYNVKILKGNIFKIKLAAKMQDGRHYLQFCEKLLLRSCISYNNPENWHNNKCLYYGSIKYDSYTDAIPIWSPKSKMAATKIRFNMEIAKNKS